MSNTINDELLERARVMSEEWTGTLWQRMIERDIKDNDLEALKHHVRQAEIELSLQEDYPFDEPTNNIDFGVTDNDHF